MSDRTSREIKTSNRPATGYERRWHRAVLSLRALMLLVLVLGGGLGWVAHRAAVQRRAVAAIEAAGGRVFYDWDLSDGVAKPPGTRRTWLKWLCDRLGPDYFGDITSVFLEGR